MSEHPQLPAGGGAPLPATMNGSSAPSVAVEGYGPGVPEGEPSGGGMKRYVSAILRYKWLVLAVALIGSAAGVFGSRYLPSEYTASARLWFTVTDRQGQSQGPIQSSELMQDYAWVELLRSYQVLEYVAFKERLYLKNAPRDRELFRTFALDTTAARVALGKFVLRVSEDGRTVEVLNERGATFERTAVGGPIGQRLGFVWHPDPAALVPKREAAFEVVTPRDAARQLEETLFTGLAGRANFMTVAYRDGDPQRVAAVVNAIIDRYLEVAEALKKTRLVTLREILDSQLVSAQQNLTTAELALENFRVNTITLPSEESAPIAAGVVETRPTVISNFFQLKIERDEIQQDRQAVVRALAAGDTLSADALSGIESVQRSPELSKALLDLTTKRAEVRALNQTYTPEHTILRRAVADVAELERRTVPQLARRLVAELDARADVLDGMINAASAELQEIPTRAIEETRLRRTMSSADRLYTDLRQRFEGARLAAETTVPDIQILDRAKVPSRPEQDARIRILLLVVAGSIGLALGLAILLDRMDHRLHYPEQVTEGLRLPIMAAVPHISARPRALSSGVQTTQVIEALRGIRLSVMQAYGSAGPLMLTVTSPGPGDGKTFLTSNLALSFADLGWRVVVVDGDTRRGDMHRLFDRPRKPGLTDYLAGKAGLEEVLQETRFPQVQVVTSGSRITNGPELVASARMGELIASLKARYDAILFDTPPMGAGIDPLVLATATGNMLLVMRTGKTDRQLAEAKLELVDRLPVRILGVVLNGVATGGLYRYYSYDPNYEVERESATDDMAALQPG